MTGTGLSLGNHTSFFFDRNLKTSPPPLSHLERAYVPEIMRALMITSRHFILNLTRHLAHLVGLKMDKPASVTFQYPEERRPMARRHRSRHRLTRRDDDRPRCVACMMCETICPAFCIFIVAGEHPDRMCPEVRGKRTAPSTPSSEYHIRRQPPRVREPRSDVGSRRCVVVESGQRR